MFECLYNIVTFIFCNTMKSGNYKLFNFQQFLLRDIKKEDSETHSSPQMYFTALKNRNTGVGNT